MAYPTSVNSQITDAVTQSNVKVIGEAPAMAMGSLYQTMAHSTGLLFENATRAQESSLAAQAAITQGVATLYTINTEAMCVPFRLLNGVLGVRNTPDPKTD